MFPLKLYTYKQQVGSRRAGFYYWEQTNVMIKKIQESEVISYILMGIFIGIGMGFVIKSAIDTYLLTIAIP